MKKKPRKKSVTALKKQTQRAGYTAYLKSPQWAAKRAQVIFRDLGQCQADVGEKRKCGSRKDIEVHHLTYVRFGNEAMTDLVTLCHDCHEKAHRRGKYRAGRAKTKKQ